MKTTFICIEKCRPVFLYYRHTCIAKYKIENATSKGISSQYGCMYHTHLLISKVLLGIFTQVSFPPCIRILEIILQMIDDITFNLLVFIMIIMHSVVKIFHFLLTSSFSFFILGKNTDLIIVEEKTLNSWSLSYWF